MHTFDDFEVATERAEETMPLPVDEGETECAAFEPPPERWLSFVAMLDAMAAASAESDARRLA